MPKKKTVCKINLLPRFPYIFCGILYKVYVMKLNTSYLQFTLHCLLASLLFASGCGFTEDKPISNQSVYQTDELKSSCKVNGDKLKDFTRQVIPEEITCIEKSLEQYLQLVKTKNPNSINEKELNLFISRFFADQSKELIDGLSVLFQTNMLLLRDEQNEISRENLPILFELLRESNAKIVKINAILDRLSELKKLPFNFPKKVSRLEVEIERFNDEIKDLSEKIVQRLETRKRPIQSIDLYYYINETVKKIGATSINTEDIENMIFLKALIVGGDVEIINSDEAKILIRKLPAIMDIWANINYLKRELFKDNQDYAAFLKDNIKKVENAVIAEQRSKVDLITEKEIEFFVRKIFNKDDLKENLETFWIVKRLIMGGEKHIVTNIEAKDLVKKIPTIIDIWAQYEDYPEESFKTKKDYYSFLGDLILDADKKLLVKNLPNELIISNQKIVQIAKQFLKKEIAIEDIDLYMRVKLIVTGNRNELTTNDLYNIIEKIPGFLSELGDLQDHPKESFPTTGDYARFLSIKLEWIKKNILLKNIPNEESEFLTKQELKKLFEIFINDPQTKYNDREELSDDDFDTILSLKRLITGEAIENLSLKEINIILNKSNSLLAIYGNIIDLVKEEFDDKTFFAKKLLETVNLLEAQITWNQDSYEVLNNQKIISLIKKSIEDNELDVTKFEPSLESLKLKLIGGNKDTYLLSDIRKIFDIVKDASEQFFYDNFMYDQYRQSFESIKGPIKLKPAPEYPAINHFFSTHRKNELFSRFKLIAENFKYFRDPNDKLQMYAFDYYRNKSGFVEVGLLKFLATKLAISYGHKIPNGNFHVNIEEFEKFLVAMKPILEEFKLWSPNFQTFARNAILLADLFQNQSNGDFEMNSSETAEYLSMILSAVEIKGRFEKEMLLVCRNLSPNQDEPIFNEPCFKEHYFDIFLNKLKLDKNFPRLAEYVRKSPRDEYQNYLKGVTGFARDVNDPRIPINGRDMTLIIGAMLNIETTFLRFDVNRDNVISTIELNEAFKIYENAIIAIAKLKPEQQKFSKSIFFYMVINMQVPKTGTWINDAAFFLFHQCMEIDVCRRTKYEPIEAKRLNIGMLLYYLVNLPQ